MPDDLTVDYTVDGGTAVIRVAGEIDIASRDTLTDAAKTVIAAGANRLVLDMSAVSFMDSSGIAAVIEIGSAAPVALREPSEIVERVLAAAGLTGTFVVEP